MDSARYVSEDFFECVLRIFGFPQYWGRYLVRVEGASDGLTRQEISFIHDQGVRLLPIYNAFRDARGYAQGRAAADNAVRNAQRLAIPEGTPLFADIEPTYRVNAEWIIGWTDGILSQGYISGIYNAPAAGGFNTAFCTAVSISESILSENILWSAQPEIAPSGPDAPPEFQPRVPSCGGNVWAWQYSRDLPICPIDVNLATRELVNLLW